MTTPNGKHEFEAAKRFFEERLKDYLEQDKSLAAQDDPVGMVHPIYVGKLVKPYYRAAIAALQDYEKVKAERERWKKMHEILSSAHLQDMDRAEKAEAELATTNKAWDIKQKQLEEARAELEKVKAERDKLSEAHCALYLQNAKNGAVIIEQMVELEKARPLIEAARGVDKRVAWQELANSDIVHGLDGGLYDLLTAIPEDK